MVFANEADPILLGGPESAPFAKYASAITENYCFKPFMVPEEEYPNATIIGFDDLNKILQDKGIHIKRIGIVGSFYFPHSIYVLLQEGFKGAEFVDITDEYDYPVSYTHLIQSYQWEGTYFAGNKGENSENCQGAPICSQSGCPFPEKL